MSKNVTVDSLYKINVDREKIILEKADWQTSPGEAVIEFRDDVAMSRPRPVVSIPIELLLFRVKNKRLISNTQSYKKRGDGIDLDSGDTHKVQDILEEMLYEKDKPAAKNLENAIKKNGQRREAVITCDGLLIDGNRRLMILKRLYKQTNDPKYKNMKVVILPGHTEHNSSRNCEKIRKDSGGPPTNKEILQIEKARQFEEKGESKYTILDKAISIKEDLAFFNNSKEEYIRSENPNLTKAKIKSACDDLEDKYLGPLRQAEMYLKWKGIDGQPDKINNWNALRDIHIYMWKAYYPKEVAIQNGLDPAHATELQQILFNVIDTGKIETDDGRKLTGDMKDIVRRTVRNFNTDPEERKKLRNILKIDLTKDSDNDKPSDIIKKPIDKPEIKVEPKGKIKKTPEPINKPDDKKNPEEVIKPKNDIDKKKKAITKILLGGQDKEKIKKTKSAAIDNLEAALTKISKDNVSVDVVDDNQVLDDIIDICEKISLRVEELRSASINRKNYTLNKKKGLEGKYPSKKNKK